MRVGGRNRCMILWKYSTGVNGDCEVKIESETIIQRQTYLHTYARTQTKNKLDPDATVCLRCEGSATECSLAVPLLETPNRPLQGEAPSGNWLSQVTHC